MGNCFSCNKNKNKGQPNACNIGSKASLHNALLDRLTVSQLKLLQTKFEQSAKQDGLDFKGFKQLMPLLTHLPDNVVDSAFKIFDIDRKGRISWHNFCLGISQYILGRREEKCKFLFAVYAIQNSSELTPKDLQTLRRACGDAIRIQHLSANNLIEQCIAEKRSLGFEEFKEWALENLELHRLLQPFEIIPSPLSEKEMIKKIMDEFTQRGLREEDEVYVVSAKWLETWKRYVNYEMEVRKEDLESDRPEMPRYRSTSIVMGSRPIEINNSELQSEECPAILKNGIVLNSDFEIIPKKAWQEFISWYGGSPEFKRYVIKVGNKLQVDLYPPVLKIHIKNETNGSFYKTPLYIPVCRKHTPQNTVNYLISLVKKKGIPKLYLIKGDHSKQLELNWTYENLGLDGENKVLFEVTEQDDLETIPVDIEEIFEEGDPVEYQENGHWLPGTIKKISSENYEIEGGWLPTEVVIPKQELLRLRKPARFPVKSHDLPGATGIVNIGNTCYMNTILQCLSNTPMLCKYFAKGGYARSINSNNPDGTKGRMAEELGLLLNEIWHKRTSKIKPVSFLQTFANKYPDFKGFNQHDSHEFLRLLLDTLHEDLNRKTETKVSSQNVTLENADQEEEIKASKEQWERIQGVNGSVISDLFGGQTRNVMECESCGHKKVVFEMFMDLSLPMPVKENEVAVSVVVVPRLSSSVKKYTNRVSQDDCFESLLSKLQSSTGISPQNLVFAKVSKNCIEKVFQPLSIEEVASETELYAYEVISSIEEAEKEGRKCEPETPSEDWRQELDSGSKVDYLCKDDYKAAVITTRFGNQIDLSLGKRVKKTSIHDSKLQPYRQMTYGDEKIIQLPLMNCKANGRKGVTNFGIPQLVTIGSWYEVNDLLELVFKTLEKYTNSKKLDSNSLFVFVIGKQSLRCALCENKKCPGCSLKPNNDPLAWFAENQESICLYVYWSNPYLYRYTPIQDYENLEDFSIYDCFENFVKPETIEFKCEKCEHQNSKSQTEIWRVPDILIIQIKRFSFRGFIPQKINNLVEFPTKCLDISNWMLSSQKKAGLTISDARENFMYDLFGVVNHSGSAMGGHYTSYCLNQDKTDTWLYHDDDRVFQVTGDTQQELVSPKAYILFYKRQRVASSNLVNLFVNH